MSNHPSGMFVCLDVQINAVFLTVHQNWNTTAHVYFSSGLKDIRSFSYTNF